MAKRMLDCCASDFAQFTKADLLESIQKSEGRVIACETRPGAGNVTLRKFCGTSWGGYPAADLFAVRRPSGTGRWVSDHPPAEKARRAAPSASIWSPWRMTRRSRPDPSYVGPCPPGVGLQ